MSSRPEVERALFLLGSTPSEEEARRFYALRVADYARALTLVLGGLYLAGVVLTLAALPELFVKVHLHPAKLVNLGFVLVSGTLWYFARRPDCPAWLAAAGDVLLPLGVATVLGIVSATASLARGIYFMPLLIGGLVLVLRAALVPSPARRTALVGIATAVPIIWASNILIRREPSLPAPFTPLLVTCGAAAWCVGLVGSTSLVSRVIYGLRREVESAKKLGQYVLGELIGEGGMGRVYRAQHALLRRPTAVKLLLPERAGPQNIARFEREVQLTASLTHPNTVAIYDYGRTPDATFYYAMEYLDGLSLEDLVRRFGPQPPARVIHMLLQASGALVEAHGLGLIHRDVKPANLLFCERGGLPDVVKLVDFGLVKSLDSAAGPELTHSDAITGTPLYLAPESIVDPSSIDHRVDLYALGGVGYFLLTGQPPFEGRSVLEICGHHLHTAPQRPSERLGTPIPAALEELVLRCLAKKPDDRPRDAQALHDELLLSATQAPWVLAEARAWWRDFHSKRAPAAPGAADAG